MLGGLALNLASSGLASGGGLVATKVRDILRDRRFSPDVEKLATEFNTALKKALTREFDKDGREDLADLDTDWRAIAETLDEIDVVFEGA